MRLLLLICVVTATWTAILAVVNAGWGNYPSAAMFALLSVVNACSVVAIYRRLE